MKLRDKILSIIAVLATFGYLVFLLKSTLTPFILSLIISYFLSPLVNFLSKKYSLSRLTSTAIILGLFVSALVTLFFFLVPVINSQFAALLSTIPVYLKTILNVFYPWLVETLGKAGIVINADLSHLLENDKITSSVVRISKNIFNNALLSSMTFLNILSIIFITPILVFYLLKDWEIMIEKINTYLPRKIATSSKKIASDIDKTLSSYLRGQFNVCLIIAIIYSILLTFTGLDFGFLIGFLTGFFSFIPYVGMLCGVAAAIIVALLQWGFDITQIGLVAGVFLLGQIIESNFLTPKLIGDKIGIHPVWLIFGLFAFGTLFGFIGILLAVPLTAILGVLIKHFALIYKKKFT